MPTIEVNGKPYETDEEGYLVNLADWTEDVAQPHREDGERRDVARTTGRSSISCASTTRSTRSPRPCAC